MIVLNFILILECLIYLFFILEVAQRSYIKILGNSETIFSYLLDNNINNINIVVSYYINFNAVDIREELDKEEIIELDTVELKNIVEQRDNWCYIEKKWINNKL
jgi:hypothetical protein